MRLATRAKIFFGIGLLLVPLSPLLALFVMEGDPGQGFGLLYGLGVLVGYLLHEGFV